MRMFASPSMAVYKLSNCYQMDLEEGNFCGSEGEYSSDDLENDPNYSIVEETLGRFSNLSVEKKSATRFVSDPVDSDRREINVQECDESDEKSFEEVQKIIGDRQLEKLKVEQCKVYLRKNGLRLTGNKETLIQRIKEHVEILNGGGEKKYPPSTFVLNCKGDACTGDIVMFEQNVYEMFILASRSASGPPCGTRIVAGRIVKESYGSAKQQHTFTIEVLWSKGVKPFPPLHPLLIKGRNLYRLKTLRQRWEDEGKRHQVLMEKHLRGSLARSDREARVQEKEKKKRTERISRKESTRNQSQCNLTSVPKSSFQPQLSGLPVNSGKPNFQNQRSSGAYANSRLPEEKEDKHINQASENMVQYRTLPDRERKYTEIQDVKHMSKDPLAGSRPRFHLNDNQGPINNSLSMNGTNGFPLSHRQPLTTMNGFPPIGFPLSHRQPLTTMNGFPPIGFPLSQRQPFTTMNGFPPIRQFSKQQQLCPHYAKGRCYYGDNCKFSHGTREEHVQRREERLPLHQTSWNNTRI